MTDNKKMNGVAISKVLYDELKAYIATQDGCAPEMIDISVGDDLGGQVYSNMKKKKIEKETGFLFESIHYDDISYNDLLNIIKKYNEDNDIYGIMLQLPLTKQLQAFERQILDGINENKDVDGLTSISMGKLVVGDEYFIPCTPKGIITLLKVYGINLDGAKVCIINRSNIVGKPLEQLFLRENATTTICHSHTKNLQSITSQADIVVAALNQREFITSDFIKEGAVVIDVGVHKTEDGIIVGDVKYDDVYKKAALITPPTGCVGTMTICMLAYNLALSYYGDKINDVLNSGIEKAKVKKYTRK